MRSVELGIRNAELGIVSLTLPKIGRLFSINDQCGVESRENFAFRAISDFALILQCECWQL